MKDQTENKAIVLRKNFKQAKAHIRKDRGERKWARKKGGKRRKKRIKKAEAHNFKAKLKHPS